MGTDKYLLVTIGHWNLLTTIEGDPMRKLSLAMLLLFLSLAVHAKDGSDILGTWKETEGGNDDYIKIVQKGVELEFFVDEILFLRTSAAVTTSTHSISSIARWGVDGSLIIHANILGRDFKDSESRILIMKLIAPDKIRIEETRIYYTDDDLTPDLKTRKGVSHFTRVK